MQTVFEADPRHWQSGAIRSRLGNPGDIARLPFLRAKVQDVEMDLGLLEKSQATYMEFNAGGVVCDDLRLAYSKIMTEYEVYNEDEFEEMPDVSFHPVGKIEAGMISWEALQELCGKDREHTARMLAYTSLLLTMASLVTAPDSGMTNARLSKVFDDPYLCCLLTQKLNNVRKKVGSWGRY